MPVDYQPAYAPMWHQDRGGLKIAAGTSRTPCCGKAGRTEDASLLVLLVPREMKIEHRGGVKAMTDEQLEAGCCC
jgi:hypothetical protein